MKKDKAPDKTTGNNLEKAPSQPTTPTTSSSRSVSEREASERPKEAYAYLPTRALRWRQITRHGYAAEPDGYSYIVHRQARRDAMGFGYWFASAKAHGDTDAILLGDAFMNRWEAMEVCEAWEFERVKQITALAPPDA